MTEGIDRDDWTLEELLEAFRDALEDELHTALPARVESYDGATQKAVVQPMVRRNLENELGDVVTELLPPVRNVPILVQRGGGFFGPHFPLGAGDFVLLVIAERDFSRFLQSGQLSVAPDSRLHHLAHAIALPGLFPNSAAIGSLPGDALELGNVTGPRLKITGSEIQAGGTVALAEYPDLDAHLSAIADDLDLINLAIPTMVSVLPAARMYGAVKKLVLDGTDPIATTVVKGT